MIIKLNMKKIVIVIFIILIYYFGLKIKIENSNEQFINHIFKHTIFYNKKKDFNFDIFSVNKPVKILELSFGDKYDIEFNYNENYNKEPLVYIYNTHPLEMYDSSYYTGYDINPGVVMASTILTNKLNENNIPTILEHRSVSDYIKNNNLSYDESYKGSNYYLKETLDKYKSLQLIIDLHRDGTSKDNSTVEIDGVKYAKVMFVQNVNYEKNYKLVESLNKLLDKYPNISRGIYKKYIGTLNQELNENVILLELGGNYNTIEEVVNTIDILVEIIKEKLNEN